MLTRMLHRSLITTVLALTLSAQAADLGSSITYQGRLDMDGSPLTGEADLGFSLWDADVGGNQIGFGIAAAAVPIVDGVFTIELDFGAMAFVGDARWLEIKVASPPAGPFVTLTPRQPLTAAPFALHTRGIQVDDAGRVGIGTSTPTTELEVSGSITATAFVGDGSALTNLPTTPSTWSENGSAIYYEAGQVGVGTSDLDIGDQLTVHGGDLAIRNDQTIRFKRADGSTAGLIDPAGEGMTLLETRGGDVTSLTIGGSDITFTTDDTERMRITSAGSVGIGTDVPSSHLDVSDGDINSALRIQPTGLGPDLIYKAHQGGTKDLHVVFENAAGAQTEVMTFKGNGNTGRVGIGTTSPVSELDVNGIVTADAFVGDGTGLTGVAASGLEARTALVAWGNDDDGQVSDAPTTGRYVAIDAGNAHSVAIAEDGSLVSWGEDLLGQVSETPTSGSYVSVAAGGRHSVAIAANGSLVSWGSDDEGQVTDTPAGSGYTAVAAGSEHSVAITPARSLVSWGLDREGQVSNTPTSGNYTAVAAGGFHSVALRANGTLVSWGLDNHGQVSNTPGGSNFVAVAAGYLHSVAIRADGSLVSWGYNFYGQVIQTPSSGTYVAVAAGLRHSAAIRSDGTVVSWGGNNNGQVGQTPTNGTYTAIAANHFGTLALRPLVSLEGDILTEGGLTATSSVDIGGDLMVAGQVGIGTDDVAYQFTVEGIANFNGGVAIGLRNPVRGLVDIEGSRNHDVGGYGWLNGDGNIGTASGTAAYSLYASRRIAASEFNAHSDARIKIVGGLSDVDADLDTLLAIEVTDYTMVDKVANGSEPYKKVIGQQVRSVFPQAVTISADVVPDIYQMASVEDGWIVLATDLEVGDRVRLIAANGGDVHDVLEVGSDRFRVADSPAGKVFVYGREVDDFHNVDYEAIAMLNVSATQALYQRIADQQEQLKLLQADRDAALEALHTANARLTATNAELADRLARVEALLEQSLR